MPLAQKIPLSGTFWYDPAWRDMVPVWRDFVPFRTGLNFLLEFYFRTGCL